MATLTKTLKESIIRDCLKDTLKDRKVALASREDSIARKLFAIRNGSPEILNEAFELRTKLLSRVKSAIDKFRKEHKGISWPSSSFSYKTRWLSQMYYCGYNYTYGFYKRNDKGELVLNESGLPVNENVEYLEEFLEHSLNKRADRVNREEVSDELSAEIDAYNKDAEVFRKDQSKLESSLELVLKSVRTVKQLRDQYPDLAKYLPDEEAGKGLIVPISQEDLREQMLAAQSGTLTQRRKKRKDKAQAEAA